MRISPGDQPVASGTVYRTRFEKGFVRYLWHDASRHGTAGYWEAQHPDGRRSFFGADAQGVVDTNAVVTGRNGAAFRYHVVETVDVHGHAMRYHYTRDGLYALLDSIEYVFTATTQRFRITFAYEERPDHLSDCASGVNVVLTKRLKSISVFSSTERIRRYALTYDDPSISGGLSRLSKVETFGLQDQLHPVVHQFEYSRALGASCTTAECGQPYLVDMGSLQGANLATGTATLLDINGDSLPDVLDSSGSNHKFFLNQLSSAFYSQQPPPAQSHQFIAGQIHTGVMLGNDRIQELDANGDGFADIVDYVNNKIYYNRGGGTWDRVEDVASSAGFPALPDLRFLDYDNDKRIDVVYSDSSSTQIFRNTGSGYVADTSVETLGADFHAQNIQFADMNGDGLLDVVRLQSDGNLYYRLNLGWGRWSGTSTSWTQVNLAFNAAEMALSQLEDLNGDGLADVVVVNEANVRYALNRNGQEFTSPVTLSSILGGSQPTLANATVLMADMNGNGSQDIVWASPVYGIKYLELFPVRPNLLHKITNGIGRVTDVGYTTSVAEAARAREAGNPWLYQLPYPMNVVHVVDEHDLLSQVHDVTSYRYRDGYYDETEKQYRGYERVEIEDEGDPGIQDAGLITSVFDLGQTKPHRAGLLLSQTLTSGTKVIRRTFFTYEDCTLDDVGAAVPLPEALEALGRKAVRHVCKTREVHEIQEGRPQEEWATTTETWQYDGYGNVGLHSQLGLTGLGSSGCAQSCSTALAGHPCGTECTGDEHFTQTWYVVPGPNTEGKWIINAPYKQQLFGRVGSQVVTETRTYYDGTTAFQGLPEGKLSKGLTVQVTQRVNTAGDLIQRVRQRHDPHGNVVESIDPLGALTDENNHRRRYTYDADGLNVTRVDVMLARGTTPYQLRQEVSYSPTWSKPTQASGWLRVSGGSVVSERHTVHFTYDAFGRPATRVRPGRDTANSPTDVYEYILQSPASSITTRSRGVSGGPLDMEQTSCVDGRGRQFQVRTKVAENQYVVTGFTVFNKKSNPLKVYQPYTSTSAACDTTPPSVPFVSFRYDAADRQVGSVKEDGSITETRHLPLAHVALDEEDTDTTSLHVNTPVTQRVDGLGRTLFVEKPLTSTGTPEMFGFMYDELRRMRGFVDPAKNVKTQEYDLAGRLVSVTDPNAGTSRFTYDAASNVVTRTDAAGRSISMAYDGNNRMVERWDTSNREGTIIRAVYDFLEECPTSDCSNTASQLAGVSYPAGADRYGYDERGRGVYSARQLEGQWYETRSVFDNADNLVQQTMPDGQLLTRRYDSAMRLKGVDDIVDDVTYASHGQLAGLNYHNGLSITREFNELLRLTATSVRDRAGVVLQDLGFLYDRVGNVVNVDDARPASTDGVRHDGTYTYDAWYRLVKAELGTINTETLSFTYDAINNLLKANSTVASSRAHVGNYTYASAHPNAAVSAGSLTMSYDPAGYMTDRGGLTMTWDFMGRLVSACSSDGGSTYVYGGNHIRVSTLEPEGVTHYISDEFEIRDGISSTYVRAGRAHLARIDSDELMTRIFRDVGPINAPDGEINAGDAWLSHADSKGIVDVSGTTSPSDRLLLAAARRLLFDNSPTKTWFATDHLGSITLATDDTGSVVGRRSYYPFGEYQAQSGTVGDRGFTGQERDDDTGFTHFEHRYLDTWAARWTSSDPAFTAYTPDGIERLGDSTTAYAYVSNNPLSAFDPDGLGLKKLSDSPGAAKAKQLSNAAKRNVKRTMWKKIGVIVTGVALGIAAVAVTAATLGMAAPVIGGAVLMAAIPSTVGGALKSGAEVHTYRKAVKRIGKLSAEYMDATAGLEDLKNYNENFGAYKELCKRIGASEQGLTDMARAHEPGKYWTAGTILGAFAGAAGLTAKAVTGTP